MPLLDFCMYERTEGVVEDKRLLLVQNLARGRPRGYLSDLIRRKRRKKRTYVKCKGFKKRRALQDLRAKQSGRGYNKIQKKSKVREGAGKSGATAKTQELNMQASQYFTR